MQALKTHEVDVRSEALTSCQHFKTRSVCLPMSLKFKYEKGGRRDMANKTTHLCKAKEYVSHVLFTGSCASEVVMK